jgi:hypothetical protein
MYGAFFLTGVAIVLALATTGTATIGGDCPPYSG